MTEEKTTSLTHPLGESVRKNDIAPAGPLERKDYKNEVPPLVVTNTLPPPPPATEK